MHVAWNLQVGMTLKINALIQERVQNKSMEFGKLH